MSPRELWRRVRIAARVLLGRPLSRELLDGTVVIRVRALPVRVDGLPVVVTGEVVMHPSVAALTPISSFME